MKSIAQYISESLQLGKGSRKLHFEDMPEIGIIYSDAADQYKAWEADVNDNPEEAPSWEDFIDMCWQDAQEEIEKLDKSVYLWVVVGSSGHYSGKHKIVPTSFEILKDAINTCLGRNHETLRLTVIKDNTLKCEVGHHDGVDCYNIIPLNNEGEELFTLWEENEEDDISFIYDPKNRAEINF